MLIDKSFKKILCIKIMLTIQELLSIIRTEKRKEQFNITSNKNDESKEHETTIVVNPSTSNMVDEISCESVIFEESEEKIQQLNVSCDSMELSIESNNEDLIDFIRNKHIIANHNENDCNNAIKSQKSIIEKNKNVILSKNNKNNELTNTSINKNQSYNNSKINCNIEQTSNNESNFNLNSQNDLTVHTPINISDYENNLNSDNAFSKTSNDNIINHMQSSYYVQNTFLSTQDDINTLNNSLSSNPTKKYNQILIKYDNIISIKEIKESDLLKYDNTLILIVNKIEYFNNHTSNVKLFDNNSDIMGIINNDVIENRKISVNKIIILKDIAVWRIKDVMINIIDENIVSIHD